MKKNESDFFTLENINLYFLKGQPFLSYSFWKKLYLLKSIAFFIAIAFVLRNTFLIIMIPLFAFLYNRGQINEKNYSIKNIFPYFVSILPAI